jgi:microcystin-dependent protein
MSSTYTQNTGIEKPDTGDKSGTWGVTVNTNFDIIDVATHGQKSITIYGSQDLTTSDGVASDGAYKVLALTGTPGATFELRVTPTDQEKHYIIKNDTDAACRIIYKGVTYSTSNGVEIASGGIGQVTGDGGGASGVFTSINPNTDLINDLTPQLGGNLDVNSQSIVSVSNGDITLAPDGTGEINLTTDVVVAGKSNTDVTVTTNGTGDLTLNTNAGSSSGSIVIADGANNNITITPNGAGSVVIDGLSYPQADGNSGDLLQTDGAGNLTFSSSGGVPSGGLLPYAGSTAPSGYLLCFGQAVSRTTYADLFTAISTTYGVGDGSTTFNLPDLRGRVIAGQDDMGGTSADRLTNQSGGLDGDVLGDTGGAETHTLTTAEMPAHTHTVPSGGAGASNYALGGPAGSFSASQTTGSEGGGGAHNNVQPTIILNYIIKT